MALVAEEAAAAWPGFVLLHYCQTFHWVSVCRNHNGTIKYSRVLPCNGSINKKTSKQKYINKKKIEMKKKKRKGEVSAILQNLIRSRSRVLQQSIY